MDVALGDIYTGVFTVRTYPCYAFTLRDGDAVTQSSDDLWKQLNAAGEIEYDRFWRMPLDEDYGPQIYSSNADLCNVCPYTARLAISCT